MDRIKINIANKTYDVKIAQTDEEKETGLQNIANLPENEGMLFVFDTPQTVSFWMKDTVIPLDIIFLDEDMKVVYVANGEPNSEKIIEVDNISYVLEVNKGSGISIGDEMELYPNDKMLLLDADGKVQMELEGNERLFSREHTKKLIKYAKKAYLTKKDNDYKTLGEKLFDFLEIQENTEPEYVDK